MFRHSANLSALEFVPASSGSLLVDIVVPSCPVKKDSTTGELVAKMNLFEFTFGCQVDTFWCPLTSSCEQTCYSFLGMQNDWDTEWGAEWKCTATSLDFCLSEGMCNYPDSCPFNSRGEWGEDTLIAASHSFQEEQV